MNVVKKILNKFHKTFECFRYNFFLLISISIEGLGKLKMFRSLKMTVTCPECWKRFGVKEGEFESTGKICAYCFGLLANSEVELVAKSIEDFLKSERLDVGDYNLAVSLPMSLLLRDKLAEFELKSVPLGGVRDSWRQAVTNKLSLPFNSKSDFTITVTYTYERDDFELKEIVKFLGGDPAAAKSRNSLTSFLNSVDITKIPADTKSPTFAPSNSEIKWTISWARDPLIIGGRYRKYSRYLCQTPWLIDGKLKSKTSIEELIINPIKSLVEATDYKFSSAGREDTVIFPIFVEMSYENLSSEIVKNRKGIENLWKIVFFLFFLNDAKAHFCIFLLQSRTWEKF